MIRLIKFLLRCLFRLLYRVEVTGLDNYDKAGKRVLLIANHTSLLDGVLLYAYLPETPTFAINTGIAAKKSFRFFLHFVDLFVMDYLSPFSVKAMIKYIKADNKAVIFPEGRITTTGSLMKIYEGPALIADNTNAAILPIAIDGAQFGPFSYAYLKSPAKAGWFPKITITILQPEKLRIEPGIQGHARRKKAALQLNDIMFKLSCSSFNHRTTIFDAFLHAARRYGKNRIIAEDIERKPISYKQLALRSFILGRAIKNDTEQDEIVGVMLPNTLPTLIIFMALQYLGRVPAMLNFTSGTMALLHACETGRMKTIYSSRKFIENADLQNAASELEKHANLIYLEEVRPRIGAVDKLIGIFNNFTPLLHYRHVCKNKNPDSPAVIIFTSGSEGHPKGVVLSHANLLSNYAQARSYIELNPNDTVFSCLPLFHSFGLNGGFLMPLLSGSRAFFYPTPLHYRIIPELIYELNASILFSTNTFLKAYARHAHPFDFHSLRYVVAGAEKLHIDTTNTWMEKFGIRIYQGYGVTETSPVISANTAKYNKTGTVGRLIPWMQACLEPVEGINSAGRLLVKGPNVMLGYLLYGNDGSITTAPETGKGAGWYDTGDIAGIDDEGFISIQGRSRRFAKIGSEMASLAAVEELAMQTWPGYSHAALSLPDESRGEKIMLVTDFPDANRKALQECARKHKIGALYIPREIIHASEIPILGTGKIDYTAVAKLIEHADKPESAPTEGSIESSAGHK